MKMISEEELENAKANPRSEAESGRAIGYD